MTDSIVGVTHHIDAELLAKQVALDTALATIATMKADWAQLNKLMVTEADDRDWCSEYDEKVDSWNNSLTLLQLTSRIKTFTVSLTIKLDFEQQVEVKAISSDHARDKIDDWSLYDLLSGINLHDYNDSDRDITGVKEGSL